MAETRIALVTGANRGIGRAITEALLQRGIRKVYAAARDPQMLGALIQDERVVPLRLDVTDARAAGNAIQSAVDAFGRLDLLVNNAGYANVNSIEDMAAEDFREQIETNFFGVVNVTRAALPVFRTQRDGHIIQISSVGGRGAKPGLSAYRSAKWAVGGFSEVLAKEVGPLGIKVTVVEPGGIRTDFSGSSMRVGAVRPAAAQDREPDSPRHHVLRGDHANGRRHAVVRQRSPAAAHRSRGIDLLDRPHAAGPGR